jgi:hypothetical protein
MFVESGLAVLHGAPPPVHDELPMETTFVEYVVLTVCMPEQEMPRVAPLQM